MLRRSSKQPAGADATKTHQGNGGWLAPWAVDAVVALGVLPAIVV